MWLDNGLRRHLDARAAAEGRSLAGTIEFYLRKGLGLKTEKPAKSSSEAENATVFG